MRTLQELVKGPSREDVELVADLARRCRDNPEDFRRGKDLLTSRFSVEAIRRQRTEKLLDYLRRDHRLRRHIPWRERRAEGHFQRMRARCAVVTEAEALRETLDWFAQRPSSMSREEAEAGCLAVLALYDDADDSSPALPPWLANYRRVMQPGSDVHAVILAREMLRLRDVLRNALARISTRTGPRGGSDVARLEQTAEPKAAAAQRRPVRNEWLARAMLLVREHPEWFDARIARECLISPSSLSRSREYKAAAGMARQEGGRIPRGFRVRDDATMLWDVEARAEETEDAGLEDCDRRL